MKQLIFTYMFIACALSSNAIIFSSDNHIGAIDTFILKKDILNCTKSISKYFTDYSNAENHFSHQEPTFITSNGALLPIDMPTLIKPFIVIFHDAQHIIDQNPTVFCLENLKNKTSFISQNQSNRAIHAKLADTIIPIDHCSHIKNNKSSIDIVSIFFDIEILSLCIPRLHINLKKRTLDVIRQKRSRKSLSVPSYNSDSLAFNYEKTKDDDDDQSIVRQANMAYYAAGIQEDPDIVPFPVHDYDFWKSS